MSGAECRVPGAGCRVPSDSDAIAPLEGGRAHLRRNLDGSPEGNRAVAGSCRSRDEAGDEDRQGRGAVEDQPAAATTTAWR